MKSIILSFLCISLAAVGCGTLLGNKPTAKSFVAEINPAYTNDVNLVAYMKVAKDLNDAIDGTPVSPLVNALLGAGVAISTCAAGWFARHSVVAKVAPNTTNVQSSVDNKAPPA